MNEKILIEDFEINPLTVAVLPLEYEGDKIYSKVYQLDEESELYAPFKPLDLIKTACNIYGSSYEGRKDGSRHLVGITHKIPIAIDPTNSIYFFPTTSPSRPQCAWISYEHICAYKKIDSKNTLVTFHNNKSIVLPISKYSFDSQVKRAALLQTRIMQKIRDYKRRSKNHSKASESITKYGESEEYIKIYG
ncbi:competence protein ComK [Niallia sp. XMNu-256]|uniref:competence protein ComK n=1 Tax=Niallia sp. XMNu-256 TaxID=3082444 RepID=UPI0030CB1B18